MDGYESLFSDINEAIKVIPKGLKIRRPVVKPVDKFAEGVAKLKKTVSKGIVKTAVERAVAKYREQKASKAQMKQLTLNYGKYINPDKPYIFASKKSDINAVVDDANINKNLETVIMYGMFLCMASLLNHKTVRLSKKPSATFGTFYPNFMDTWKLINTTTPLIKDNNTELYFNLRVDTGIKKKKDTSTTLTPPAGQYSSRVDIQMYPKSWKQDTNYNNYLRLQLNTPDDQEKTGDIWITRYVIKSMPDSDIEDKYDEFMSILVNTIHRNNYEDYRSNYGEIFRIIKPDMWDILDQRLVEATQD